MTCESLLGGFEILSSLRSVRAAPQEGAGLTRGTTLGGASTVKPMWIEPLGIAQRLLLIQKANLGVPSAREKNSLSPTKLEPHGISNPMFTL